MTDNDAGLLEPTDYLAVLESEIKELRMEIEMAIQMLSSRPVNGSDIVRVECNLRSALERSGK
jgi:hypothetical protein